MSRPDQYRQGKNTEHQGSVFIISMELLMCMMAARDAFSSDSKRRRLPSIVVVTMGLPNPLVPTWT